MTVREQEELIRRLPIETAVAWNAEGVAILKKSGEKDRIVFTDEELVLLQGTVFTHNHPSGLAFLKNDPRSFGNSFSQADLRLACCVSLTELRAVTPRLRFLLKPSSAGWDTTYWEQVLEPIYLGHKADVTREILSALKLGKLRKPVAEAMHFHEICRRTALEAGLNYQREEN
jgi:hypothetical protein